MNVRCVDGVGVLFVNLLWSATAGMREDRQDDLIGKGLKMFGDSASNAGHKLTAVFSVQLLCVLHVLWDAYLKDAVRTAKQKPP